MTQFIVETAIVHHDVADDGNKSSLRLANKATIVCSDFAEASAIAETLNFMPNRRAWAGVQHYTEGGQSVRLSFSDLSELARVARKVLNDRNDYSAKAAE